MRSALLLTAALAIAVAPASAATIWTGPKITFTKAGFTDASLAANQDRLTDSVWITRSGTQGLYNAAAEAAYNTSTPSGTRWAVGTTADLGSLVFSTWLGTVGTTTPIGGPPNSVGRDLVVHLMAEDIYLDLRFLSWGQGNGAGGSFSYERTTAAPVPEPQTLTLALGAIAAARTRRRRTAN